MKEFVLINRQFVIMLLLWSVAPIFIGSIGSVVLVSLSLVFLFMNKMHLEFFLGFIFVLVLSDNLIDQFAVFKFFKNIYIVLALVYLYLNSSEFSFSKILFRGFIPFFIIAVYALSYSGALGIGVQKTISYMLLLIIVPSFIYGLLKIHSVQLFKHIIYFLIIIQLIGLLFTLFGYNYTFIEGGRFRGLFGNPNGLGIFLFLCFMFFYYVNANYPNLFELNSRRFFYFFFFFFIILTGSRSALVSALMILLFGRLQKNSVLLAFLFFVIILFSYQFILINFVELTKDIGLENYFRTKTLEEGSGRFIAWQFAWLKIQPFYYFGGGFGNDEFIMRQNYRELAMLGHQGGVHNSYLTFWFDSGIIGVVLYFGNFIWLFIKTGIKKVYSVPCLYAVLFSITYESWLAGSLNPFTILLFMTMSLFYVTEINSTDENSNFNIL